MNRSLTNSIVKACLRGSRYVPQIEARIYDQVDIAVIFPRDFFGPYGPDDLGVKLLGERVMRPVMPGLWWAPDDPAKPKGDGLAMVTLKGWEADPEYGVEACADRVYHLRIEHENGWFYPDIHTLIDKRHKIKSAEGATFTEDPETYRAAVKPFTDLRDALGYIPSMHSWLYDFYGGRWFVAFTYDPGHWRPRTDPEFRWLVSYLEAVRSFGAEIRVYPYGRFASGCPAVFDYQQSFFFMKALDAHAAGDLENWRLYSRDHDL